MKNSILYQLYNGEISPCEQSVSQIQGYTKIRYALDKKVETLKEQVSKDTYAQLLEIEELFSQLNSLEHYDIFRSGFHLATQLFVEGIAPL